VQQVRFGQSLDGQRGWLLLDALGEPIDGPLGALTLLETQLRLLRVGPTQPELVVQMRDCSRRRERQTAPTSTRYGSKHDKPEKRS
jgi:hypothetical protein